MVTGTLVAEDRDTSTHLYIGVYLFKVRRGPLRGKIPSVPYLSSIQTLFK